MALSFGSPAHVRNGFYGGETRRELKVAFRTDLLSTLKPMVLSPGFHPCIRYPFPKHETRREWKDAFYTTLFSELRP